MLFKKRPRRKDVIRSFTLRGGLQTLTDALAEHDRVAAKTDIPVCSIEPDGASLLVTTGDGRRFAARHLALAVPPPNAADLVREAFPELAQWSAQHRLEEVKYVGAEALVSACPWCKNNFAQAVKADGNAIEVLDISEVILASIATKS